jgi:hypothetical protein
MLSQTSLFGPGSLHLVLMVLPTCLRYTLPHLHGMQYVLEIFMPSLPFIDLSIWIFFPHKYTNCICVAVAEKPADFVWDSLLISIIAAPSSFSFFVQDLCFGARICMISWFLCPSCLKVFFIRWLFSMTRLSSWHLVLAHWMRLFGTAVFCVWWCSDFVWS